MITAGRLSLPVQNPVLAELTFRQPDFVRLLVGISI
jgi:hypothetical protein